MSGSPAKTKTLPRGCATSGNAGGAFTPDDANDLPNGPCFGFAVTTAGAYKVTFVDDATPVTVYCNTGYNPYAVKRIWSTGSVSAAGVLPLYA